MHCWGNRLLNSLRLLIVNTKLNFFINDIKLGFNIKYFFILTSIKYILLFSLSLLDPVNASVISDEQFPLKCFALVKYEKDCWSRLSSDQTVFDLISKNLPDLKCLILPTDCHWLDRKVIMANSSLVVWSYCKARVSFSLEATLMEVKSRSELDEFSFNSFPGESD